MKDAPLAVRIVAMVFMCGTCGFVIVGLISGKLLAFGLAAASMLAFGAMFVAWRLSRGGGAS